MGIIFRAAGWLLVLASAEIMLSSLVRFALNLKSGRETEREPDQFLPGIAAVTCLVCLILLGVIPALPGGAVAAIVFAVSVWPMERMLLQDDGEFTWSAIPAAIPAAVYGTLVALLSQPAHGVIRILEDLGSLTGHQRASAGRPARPDGPPKWAAVARPRNIPPLLEDPYLGAHPYPADIAAGLELSRVLVPPHWERLAQVISDFEAEDDNDLTGHMTGEAAGVLTAAAAIENRAENLAAGRGLDPVIVAAHFDIAEGFAELATRYALLVRRDHLVHGEVREWRDNGGVLPRDAREWFDAGSPGDGGRAA